MDCGCGRSPNGKCLGWHDLSEEEYKEKLKEYEANQKVEELSFYEAYKTSRRSLFNCVLILLRFLGLSTSVPFLKAT